MSCLYLLLYNLGQLIMVMHNLRNKRVEWRPESSPGEKLEKLCYCTGKVLTLMDVR